MAFIPLTGGGSLVDNIIDRFQDEPGFDFIAYTDAQQVTGELFRELIGPDFEPYKGLATYADIQANASAIALADANQNVQKIIEGITESVSGFALEAPGFELITSGEFIVFNLTPTISTPETSDVQYRIDGGNWVTIGSGTTIQTYSEAITGLQFNTTYTIEFRQSLFGTQSIIGSEQVTTVADYTELANDQTGLSFVANSSIVMGDIANSTTALSDLFNSEIARETFWDSEIASGILMDSNNASRQWMIDNVSHIQSFEQATDWIQRYSGKVFVLFFENGGQNYGQNAGYRYIQPGNGDFMRLIGSEDRSDRVFPLETKSDQSRTYGNVPRVRWVIMDRTDLDGQNL